MTNAAICEKEESEGRGSSVVLPVHTFQKRNFVLDCKKGKGALGVIEF